MFKSFSFTLVIVGALFALLLVGVVLTPKQPVIANGLSKADETTPTPGAGSVPQTEPPNELPEIDTETTTPPVQSVQQCELGIPEGDGTRWPDGTLAVLNDSEAYSVRVVGVKYHEEATCVTIILEDAKPLFAAIVEGGNVKGCTVSHNIWNDKWKLSCPKDDDHDFIYLPLSVSGNKVTIGPYDGDVPLYYLNYHLRGGVVENRQTGEVEYMVHLFYLVESGYLGRMQQLPVQLTSTPTPNTPNP